MRGSTGKLEYHNIQQVLLTVDRLCGLSRSDVATLLQYIHKYIHIYIVKKFGLNLVENKTEFLPLLSS